MGLVPTEYLQMGRMKIAVLFSLVVLALVAFLKPASGCDCVKYLSGAPKSVIKTLEIPAATMAMGPKVVCKKLATFTQGKKTPKTDCCSQMWRILKARYNVDEKNMRISIFC